MKYVYAILFLLISICTLAQEPVTNYNSADLFRNRGEIYFILKGAGSEANNLSKIISIDNIKDGDVYAYASAREFENLKKVSNHILILLPKPGESLKVPMSNITREILEWNYYPTYPAYLQIMQDFATNFPEICKLDTIGLTTEGRLIIAARISDNVGIEEDEPEFLYTSSMHGDETTGYILMLHLIDYLLVNYGTDQRITDMVNNIDIWINPLANPDGTYAGGNSSVNGATRYNANYVDINRNFPDPEDGPHPDGNEWQPETIAFMDFAERRDFVMSANFHGGAEVVNYPWDTWSRLAADNSWWIYVSREYADTVHVNAPAGYMTYLNNGITNGYAWYTVAGGRQDYMNYFHQCREVTIELSDTKLLPANQLVNHWNYNYRSLLNYMEQVTYGVRGIVTDTISGEPIEAQIFISGHDLDSSMVFSSLPVGNYHRLLKAGTYNITYFAEGYTPKTRKNISITDKSSRILNVSLWNGTPIPAFSSSDTLIAPGGTVQFFDLSGGSPTSRLWTFEGGTPSSSTEINPVITYSQVGTYNVTLKVSNMVGNNTIIKEDYIEVEEGVNVKEINQQSILIYPNPVSEQSLNIESADMIESYSISDLTGRTILQGNIHAEKASINLKDLTIGLYLLKVETSKRSLSQKILIKR